jgi:hypothetical protein
MQTFNRHAPPVDFTLCVYAFGNFSEEFEVKIFQPQTKQNDPGARLPPLACAGNCFRKAFSLSLSLARSNCDFRGAKRKLFYFFTPPSKLPARTHACVSFGEITVAECVFITYSGETHLTRHLISLYSRCAVNSTRHNENNQAQATIIWHAQTTPTFDLRSVFEHHVIFCWHAR